jgi:dTDP-D-glucose 4,6-dehydratase
MQQLLGWTPPTSLRDGLAQTVDWYRDHHARRVVPAPARRTEVRA